MKKEKRIIFIVILVATLLMGIGYAAFNAQKLIINTNAKTVSSIFKVCFDHTVDPIKDPINSETITVNTDIIAEGDIGTKVSFEGLHNEGDTASATFTIVNSGDIGAQDVSATISPSEGVSPTSGHPSYFDDGTFTFEVSVNGLTKNGELPVGKKATVTVTAALDRIVSEDTTGTCFVEILATPEDI